MGNAWDFFGDLWVNKKKKRERKRERRDHGVGAGAPPQRVLLLVPGFEEHHQAETAPNPELRPGDHPELRRRVGLDARWARARSRGGGGRVPIRSSAALQTHHGASSAVSVALQSCYAFRHVPVLELPLRLWLQKREKEHGLGFAPVRQFGLLRHHLFPEKVAAEESAAQRCSRVRRLEEWGKFPLGIRTGSGSHLNNSFLKLLQLLGNHITFKKELLIFQKHSIITL